MNKIDHLICKSLIEEQKVDKGVGEGTSFKRPARKGLTRR